MLSLDIRDGFYMHKGITGDFQVFGIVGMDNIYVVIENNTPVAVYVDFNKACENAWNGAEGYPMDPSDDITYLLLSERMDTEYIDLMHEQGYY